MRICDYQSVQYEEYENKFASIKKKLQLFTFDILDTCKDVDEARLLLSNENNTSRYFSVQSNPKIKIAIDCRHKDFVR